MLGLYIVEGIKQNRDPFSFARAEDNGRNIYLSRHKLLGKVEQKARKKFSNSLTVGTVVTGTVTCLMPCGAFIELIPVVAGWCTFRN
jgi:ribosomal protein S1